MKDTNFTDAHEVHCDAIRLKGYADTLVAQDMGQSPMRLGLMIRQADVIRHQAELVIADCDALKSALAERVSINIRAHKRA